MKQKTSRSALGSRSFYCLMAGLSVALLSPTYSVALAQETVTQTALPEEEEQAPPIPNDQLDSLVAPIALYPDPLLAQTLAASTYPLEIVQLQQWTDQNKNLEGKALADAVAKQPWDASVQSLAAAPEVVQRLAGNIQWTTDLGNAFLSQQTDVMDAVQRMRAKAEGKGTLKTSAQQTVETTTVEGGKQVIVVQPTNPEVVYVPSYDPVVVYGAAPPAYPYYPYTYPGYYPGMGLAWGAAGFALGAWAGGYWGNCNWGGGDVTINNKNTFNRNTNINRGNTNIGRGGGGGNSWQHNPKHRGGAPYPNRNVANKYPGAGNRPGGANRPSSAAGAANRPGGGTAQRPGGGTVQRPGGGTAQRPGGGTAQRPGGGTAQRPGGGTAQRPGGGTAQRPGGGTAQRPSGGGASSKPATRPSNANQMGNRQVSRSPSSGNRSAFSGSSGHMNRSSAQASHSRGSRSMGGGGHRGGGGRRR
jgi:hypothetical protein